VVESDGDSVDEGWLNEDVLQMSPISSGFGSDDFSMDSDDADDDDDAGDSQESDSDLFQQDRDDFILSDDNGDGEDDDDMADRLQWLEVDQQQGPVDPVLLRVRQSLMETRSSRDDGTQPRLPFVDFQLLNSRLVEFISDRSSTQ
jgi:hypothetical protein